MPCHSISSIPDTHGDDAFTLSLAARCKWEPWFSQEVSCHRTVERCLGIQRTRRIPEWFAYPRKHSSLLGPLHAIMSTYEVLRVVSDLRSKNAGGAYTTVQLQASLKDAATSLGVESDRRWLACGVKHLTCM